MKHIIAIAVTLMLIACAAGCAHNEHMASIATARWQAYGQAMAAYYGSLPDNRGEIVDLTVDESGKLSGLKVYASDMKPPPLPPEPKEIKPWSAQMMEASRDVLITGMKWGAGLFAVKIISENAGDDIRDSYNDNRTSARTTTDTSAIENSYNTDRTSTETTQSYQDAYNQDNSINDGYNTDNSIHDGYNTDQSVNDSQNPDNSVNDSQNPDNRYNYDNDDHSETMNP